MPNIKGISGVDWHYDIEGEGENLLFIHGWGVDKRIWRQQSKYFAQTHRVLTIDLPGHGQTSWQKVSLASMAGDIIAILEHLKFQPMTIVGSSLGGMVALKIYNQIPGQIKRLVFVGSMPKFAKSEDFPYGIDIEKMRKLEHQLQTDYPMIIDVFFRSLFSKEERQSRRYKWLQIFRKTDEPPVKQALLKYLDILEHEDLREILKKVEIPLMFAVGTDDEICNQGMVAYLREICPNSRFDYFENCGHFPFLSKPHEFNTILEEFLKETS